MEKEHEDEGDAICLAPTNELECDLIHVGNLTSDPLATPTDPDTFDANMPKLMEQEELQEAITMLAPSIWSEPPLSFLRDEEGEGSNTGSA